MAVAAPNPLRSFSNVRPLADPPSVRACPKAVQDALAERAHTRDFLSRARATHDDLIVLHEKAVEADKNARADHRLAQTGEKPEPSAPTVEAQIKEADEEIEVLEVALAKVNDRVWEALSANAEKMIAKARADLDAGVVHAVGEIDRVIDALGRVQTARDQLLYVAQIADGINPRGRVASFATSIEKPSGDKITVAEALSAARSAVAAALRTSSEEA